MDKRFWGWLLMAVGAVGIVMSVVSGIIYGVHDKISLQTMAVYGLLGLCMFSTGIEFLRRAAAH